MVREKTKREKIKYNNKRICFKNKEKKMNINKKKIDKIDTPFKLAKYEGLQSFVHLNG